MRTLIYFFSFCIILISLLIVMHSRIFNFFDVNPNLLFAIFSVLIIHKVRNFALFGMLFLLFLFSFYFYQFWVIEYIFIICSVICMLILRRFLFGNMVGDILILSSLGTVLFLILHIIFTDSPFFVVGVLYEIFFNGIWSILLYVMLRPYLRHNPIVQA